MSENYFRILNAINVNDKTEKKGKLTYLSWAYAWGEAKKLYPDSFYTIYENADGWNYHHDGRTCWVKTGVTVNGLEHIEYLPVMDNQNRSIPLERVNSFDVNKTIQRSLTKALARHGLGLYIYAGEDLPDDERQERAEAMEAAPGFRKADVMHICEDCGKAIVETIGRSGKPWSVEKIVEHSRKTYNGATICPACMEARSKQC